jgi:uncharacterized protein YbjT (DUF2867 family)
MRILVTGATGILGQAVVAELLTEGHAVAAMSRRVRKPPGVENVLADLTDGSGLDSAVRGADAVVHLAAAPYKRAYTSEVEIAGTQRLLAAAEAAGVKHVLYTSIVGADQIPWGYFATKVRAEAVLQQSTVPWSILRSAQFHEFVDKALTSAARLPVMISDPGITAQPVDVRDVAQRIGQRLAAGPSGGCEEYAGPQVLGFDDLIRQWLDIRGLRRPILHLRIPGKLGKGFRSGSLTTASEPTGGIAWKQYLAEKYL